MRILAAIVLALSLGACAHNAVVTPPDRPRLDAPSPESVRECLLPINLPKGSLTQAQVEKYWGLDRKHQIDCAKRHKILIDYITDRDSGLTGTK
jgi:hypothetical protein